MIPEIVVYYLLTFGGFTPAEAHVMTCVAKFESGFNPAAINFNSNGTLDRGLWQINTVWHNAAPFCEFDRLANPIDNVKCARVVYERQGLNAWYAYKARRAQCDSYMVEL